MSTQSIRKTRKSFAIALLVVIVWFGITGVMGPLFGKLSSVQENNNSSFLPKGAEATKAADVIATFSDEKTFNFPTLILFEGTSTPETFAEVLSAGCVFLKRLNCHRLGLVVELSGSDSWLPLVHSIGGKSQKTPIAWGFGFADVLQWQFGLCFTLQ